MPEKITETDLKQVVHNYNTGQASPEEKAFIDGYYDYFDNQNLTFDEQVGSEIKVSVMAHINAKKRLFKVRPVYRYAAAACLMLCVVLGSYFAVKKGSNEAKLVLMNDILPGGNKSVLTLSNGHKIILNDQRGTLAVESGTAIQISANGQINYVGGKSGTENLYNTLEVPLGNRRNVILADGTEVSLDAGSELSFPVAFNGNERNVKLKGRAYFKVMHNAKQPFVVKVKDLSIRDLGTEFNIDAYPDEPTIRTTLFEGSVKVNGILLVPGEQAVSGNTGIDVQKADLDATGAWRNNDFIFRNQDLHTVMQQIARWYDVEIVYNDAPQDLYIRAAISRNRNISAVLQMIQGTGKISFKVEGRKVTVSK